MSEVIAQRNRYVSDIGHAMAMWLIYGVMLRINITPDLFIADTLIIGACYSVAFFIVTGAYKEMRFHGHSADYLTTKTIKSKSLFSLLLFNQKDVDFTHYPEIKTIVIPIFHLQTMFNGPSVIAAIIFAIAYMLLEQAIVFPLELVLIGFGLGWIVYNVLNAKVLVKAWIAWNKASPHTALITSNHTKMDLYRMINTNRLLKNKLCDAFVKQMNYLAATATINSHKINRMIVEKRVDSELVNNEIALLEYVINVFIPKKTKLINEFLNRHDNRQETATQIFIKNALPILEQETKDVFHKVYEVNSLILRIELNEAELQSKEDESIIMADVKSMGLVENHVLPSSIFPEFHSLNFESIEKSVAAKSIVIRSLPPLIEAKNRTTDSIMLSKINNQIEETKQLVKALAIGTEESKKRDRLIEHTSEKNSLSIACTMPSDEISSLLAVHKRYIDKYDTLLPANQKEKISKI